jgi:hypothetical protein
MTDVRVTSIVKEVIVTEVAPDQRVTSAAVEVLRKTPSEQRITSAVIEVLRSISGAPPTVSAVQTVVCVASSGD